MDTNTIAMYVIFFVGAGLWGFSMIKIADCKERQAKQGEKIFWKVTFYLVLLAASDVQLMFTAKNISPDNVNYSIILCLWGSSLTLLNLLTPRCMHLFAYRMFE